MSEDDTTFERLADGLRAREIPSGAKERVRRAVFAGGARARRRNLGRPLALVAAAFLLGGVAWASPDLRDLASRFLGGESDVREKPPESAPSSLERGRGSNEVAVHEPSPASEPDSSEAAPSQLGASEQGAVAGIRSEARAPSKSHQPAVGAEVPTADVTTSASERASDQLATEVAAYRLAMQHADGAERLDALRRFRREYPKSSLMHEVDLQVLAVLRARGASPELGSEARSFLAKYPESPRAADVRELLEP